MYRELLCFDLPFAFRPEALLSQLHCQEEGEPVYQRCLALLAQAEPCLRHGYAAREYPVQNVDADTVTVGGQRFRSRVVADLLAGQETAFVYVASCGREIASLIAAAENVLDEYLLDQLAYLAYVQAMDELSAALERELALKQHILLCPGSVPDWSVAEVKQFFPLLDGLYQPLGLRVLDSGLIDPVKSSSGLIVGAEREFATCSLCDRPRCETRRAPFDPAVHDALLDPLEADHD